MTIDWNRKIEKFNKRWNVFGNENKHSNFTNFKTRILSSFQEIDKHILGDDVREFCKVLAISYKENSYGYIYNSLQGANNCTDIYKILEMIFSFEIYDSSHYIKSHLYDKRWYFNEVAEILEISDTGARIVNSKDGKILIIPTGEKKLDEELVNPVLSFLERKSNQHYIIALKFYEQKLWIKCAESLRRSLEEFLREKLNNKAGLKTNITNVGKLLKSQNCAAQIRNITIYIFNYLDIFFNENSKHNDGAMEESDAEFIIYQTALLMRYVEKSTQKTSRGLGH